MWTFVSSSTGYLQEGDTGLHAAVSHISTATALALASSRQDLGGSLKSLNLPPGVGFIIMIYIEV